MDAYKYTITIDGNEVYFGFDGNRELALWGGSYCITYPHKMTLKAVKDDLKANYQEYRSDMMYSEYCAFAD